MSEGGAPNVKSAVAGAIWSVRDGLSVDVGFRYARQWHESGVEMRGGFTWAFSLAPRTVRTRLCSCGHET